MSFPTYFRVSSNSVDDKADKTERNTPSRAFFIVLNAKAVTYIVVPRKVTRIAQIFRRVIIFLEKNVWPY